MITLLALDCLRSPRLLIVPLMFSTPPSPDTLVSVKHNVPQLIHVTGFTTFSSCSQTLLTCGEVQQLSSYNILIHKEAAQVLYII